MVVRLTIEINARDAADACEALDRVVRLVEEGEFSLDETTDGERVAFCWEEGAPVELREL